MIHIYGRILKINDLVYVRFCIPYNYPYQPKPGCNSTAVQTQVCF